MCKNTIFRGVTKYQPKKKQIFENLTVDKNKQKVRL